MGRLTRARKGARKGAKATTSWCASSRRAFALSDVRIGQGERAKGGARGGGGGGGRERTSGALGGDTARAFYPRDGLLRVAPLPRTAGVCCGRADSQTLRPTDTYPSSLMVHRAATLSCTSSDSAPPVQNLGAPEEEGAQEGGHGERAACPPFQSRRGGRWNRCVERYEAGGALRGSRGLLDPVPRRLDASCGRIEMRNGT